MTEHNRDTLFTEVLERAGLRYLKQLTTRYGVHKTAIHRWARLGKAPNYVWVIEELHSEIRQLKLAAQDDAARIEDLKSTIRNMIDLRPGVKT